MNTKRFWIIQFVMLSVIALSIYSDKTGYTNDHPRYIISLLIMNLIPCYFTYKNPDITDKFRKQVLAYSIGIVVFGVVYYFV